VTGLTRRCGAEGVADAHSVGIDDFALHLADQLPVRMADEPVIGTDDEDVVITGPAHRLTECVADGPLFATTFAAWLTYDMTASRVFVLGVIVLRKHNRREKRGRERRESDSAA